MGDPKFEAIYDALSPRYDQDRNEEYLHAVIALLDKHISAKAAILEVGCGTGSYSLSLAARGHTVTGLDFSKEAVRIATKKGEKTKSLAQFLRHDAEKPIPLKKPVDFVLFIDSWEFLPNPGKALAHAKAVLKPGGKIFIITPNPLLAPLLIPLEKLGIKKLSPAYGYFNSFTHRVRKVAKGNGLVLESKRYVFNFVSRFFILSQGAA